MSRTHRSLALSSWSILLAGLAACVSAPKISTDYDPGYDFTGIANYFLVEHSAARDQGGMSTTLADQRVSRAIVAEMAARGLPAVPVEDADIILNFHIVTEDRTQVTSYNDGYGYNRYGHGRAYPRGRRQVDVWQYTEGTLILDLVDSAEKRIVWRGETSAIVKDRSTEQREAMATSTIAAMFSQMPAPFGVNE
jgi:hypothetical protein